MRDISPKSGSTEALPMRPELTITTDQRMLLAKPYCSGGLTMHLLPRNLRGKV